MKRRRFPEGNREWVQARLAGQSDAVQREVCNPGRNVKRAQWERGLLTRCNVGGGDPDRTGDPRLMRTSQ